jgi:hypothetical protein
MDLLNYNFEKKLANDDKDIMNDVIYENIVLLNNYKKLIIENRKLREELNGLKSLYMNKSDKAAFIALNTVS